MHLQTHPMAEALREIGDFERAAELDRQAETITQQHEALIIALKRVSALETAEVEMRERALAEIDKLLRSEADQAFYFTALHDADAAIRALPLKSETP